ncbi:LysR family transcriptional regulator [Streptomyces sp. NPDC046939]|uniref:LysR family transcriptional regulator n=1 Tax=Streptomyces sp. NPDC046939 TaxID=3155376 RepID=UPI0033E51778
MTQLRNADLNLLEALAILLEERHISRAADRFLLSQSAMSRTLQRLRDTFGDELLIRTRTGYELTSRGRQIQAELSDILPRLEALLRGGRFDPATATDEFRMHCTDFATSALGPAIFRRVFHEGPRMSLNTLALKDDSFADAEQGRTHVVIAGVMAPAPLRWETLFEEDFVCLLSHDHPFKGQRLAIDEFTRYRHVVVALLAGEQAMVEQRLSEAGVRRLAGLRVPYFSAVPLALPGTDLIATLPRRAAAQYVGNRAYRVVEAPQELLSFPYGMAWHPRVDADPAHRWLRDVIRDAARQLPPPRTPARATSDGSS